MPFCSNLTVVAPDLHEQNFSGDDLAGVGCQERKELEFFACESHAAGVESDELVCEIYLQMLVLVTALMTFMNSAA